MCVCRYVCVCVSSVYLGECMVYLLQNKTEKNIVNGKVQEADNTKIGRQMQRNHPGLLASQHHHMDEETPGSDNKALETKAQGTPRPPVQSTMTKEHLLSGRETKVHPN